jgi:hypothetical protein
MVVPSCHSLTASMQQPTMETLVHKLGQAVSQREEGGKAEPVRMHSLSLCCERRANGP